MFKLKNFYKVFISCYLILLQLSVALSKSHLRIVGGVPTTINIAPYLVQIFKDGMFHCGGSVVKENCVITAAHCVEKVNPASLLIVGGATQLTDPGIRSKVNKIMVPEAYDNQNFNMDIAVLELTTPFKNGPVKPIPLCSKKWQKGAKVHVYGWGKRHEDVNSIPINLQMATVNAITREECASMYGERMAVRYTMACALAPGQDACAGDSGGPAVVDGELCGVVSWGIGCGHSDSPGVYTDVQRMLNLIAKYMPK